MATLTPEVLWAQRSSSTDVDKNFVYLTISVPDVRKENFKLDLKPTGLSFGGQSDSLKKKYEIDLEFFAEIDIEKSRINHTSKNVELKLQKKELNAEFWPRLLKDSKKFHFVKTDFDKWVDQDEQEEAGADDLTQFGGMDGMPGMGGMGDGLGGIDFSKLGGAGGMPGEDDEEDDEDMPGLEGAEDEEASKATESNETPA